MHKSVHQFTAKDLMTTRLITLSPQTDVFRAIETLNKNKISGAPVIDENHKLLGMFTEKSCLEVLIDAAYDGLPTNQVGAFMDAPADTIEENTMLLTIAQIFLNKKTRRLPVLKDEKLVGQVSRRDVIRWAIKLNNKLPDRASTLLYLSALREMRDVPAV